MTRSAGAKSTEAAHKDELLTVFWEGMGQQESLWDPRDLSSLDERSWGRTKVARMDALAHLDRHGLVGHLQPSVSLLINGLAVLVTHFAMSPVFAAYDSRIGQLEETSRATRATLDAVCKRLQLGVHRSLRASEADVRSHLNTIRDTFHEAFGAVPDIVVSPTDDPERPIQVLLDASRGEAATLARARVAGARSAFYGALLDRIPTAVFDSVEFEFVFPK